MNRIEIPAGVPSRARTLVSCGECGIQVLVAKTSWQQTSVQWPADAATSCPELQARADDPSAEARLRGCAALRRSIEKAALGGAIAIPD